MDASYDWCLGTPGPLPLSVRSGPDPEKRVYARPGACEARRYGACDQAGAAKTALLACGWHVERAREPRRRPEVAAAILDARVAVELLEEQVRLADVVPVLAGRAACVAGVARGSAISQVLEEADPSGHSWLL